MYYKKLENNEQTDKPIFPKMTSIGYDNFILVNDDGSEVGYAPPSDWVPSEEEVSTFKQKKKKPTAKKKGKNVKARSKTTR